MNVRFTKKMPSGLNNYSDSEFEKKLGASFRKILRGKFYSVSVVNGLRPKYRDLDTDIASESPDALIKLLDEVRKNNTLPYKVVLVASVLLMPLSFIFGFTVAIINLMAWYTVRQASKVKINYRFERGRASSYKDFCQRFNRLQQHSHMHWICFVDGDVDGARVPIETGFGMPDGMQSNMMFPCLHYPTFNIFFAPDSIIIQTDKKTNAYINTFISYNYEIVKYSEDTYAPHDASTVDKRYQYVTAIGTPDKRRKDNRQFNINEYPVISFMGGRTKFKLIASNPAGLEKLKPELNEIKRRDSAPQAAKPAQPVKVAVAEPNPAPAKVTPPAPAQVATSKPSATLPNPLTSSPQAAITKPAEPDRPLFEVQIGGEGAGGLNVTFAIGSRSDYETGVYDSSKSWIRRGLKVEVAGRLISGGFLYFRNASEKGTHPSLIDPQLPVGKSPPDYFKKLEGYYPSYERLNPHERASYLAFLASDRSDPNVAIGYVFLYFYGLERRLLVDAKYDPNVESERPSLVAELQRLHEVYQSNRSFKNYSKRLIDAVSDGADLIEATPETILPKLLPQPSSGKVNPKISKTIINKCLSMMGAEGKPMDVDWAYIWAMQNKDQFHAELYAHKPLLYKAFSEIFKSNYPTGFPVPYDETPLYRDYQPAAADLPGTKLVVGSWKAVKDSREFAHQIAATINRVTEPYLRAKSKERSNDFSIESFQYLPVDLWPPRALEAFSNLVRFTNQIVPLTLIGEMFGLKKFDKTNVTRFCTRLGENGFFMEPDVIRGASTPKEGDSVVIFMDDPQANTAPSSPSLQLAAVFVELACAVSGADGHVSSKELSHIKDRIVVWPELSDFERKALFAKVTLLAARPSSFAKLKPGITKIPRGEVDNLAKLLAGVSRADNNLSLEEIKLLEKIFSALNIPDKVHEYVHGAPVPKSPVSAPIAGPAVEPAKPEGVVLNYEKIQQLQKETQDISRILADVFEDEQPASHPVPEVKVETSVDSYAFETFPNLNHKQAQFLSVFLARDGWDRGELRGEASKLGLMLDGTLEVLNELSWDVYDEALHDGDGYIEIDPNIREKLLGTVAENA